MRTFGKTTWAGIAIGMPLVFAAPALATIVIGTDGDDDLLGTAAADTMHGLAGDDWIRSFGGPDLVSGGPGVDRLHTRGGGDRVRAGAGADRIRAGGGNDLVWAGPGSDHVRSGIEDGTEPTWIYGGPGADVVRDGDGSDLLYGGTGPDRISVVADFGWPDRAFANSGNDAVYWSRLTIRCPSGLEDLSPDSVYENCGGTYIDCGDRTDTVYLDIESDTLPPSYIRAVNCERVRTYAAGDLP